MSGEHPPPYSPGYQPGPPPPGQGYDASKMNPGYPQGPPSGYPGMPPPTGYQGMPPPGGPQYGQPYPPSGPPPPHGHQQGTTVVIGAPMVTVVGGLREGPVNVTCQQCRQAVVTRVSYETGTLTWLICGAIALFGCWLGCCFIPFCIDGCKDVRHTCPNCNTTVGVYRRI